MDTETNTMSHESTTNFTSFKWVRVFFRAAKGFRAVFVALMNLDARQRF